MILSRAINSAIVCGALPELQKFPLSHDLDIRRSIPVFGILGVTLEGKAEQIKKSVFESIGFVFNGLPIISGNNGYPVFTPDECLRLKRAMIHTIRDALSFEGSLVHVLNMKAPCDSDWATYIQNDFQDLLSEIEFSKIILDSLKAYGERNNNEALEFVDDVLLPAFQDFVVNVDDSQLGLLAQIISSQKKYRDVANSILNRVAQQMRDSEAIDQSLLTPALLSVAWLELKSCATLSEAAMCISKTTDRKMVLEKIMSSSTEFDLFRNEKMYGESLSDLLSPRNEMNELIVSITKILNSLLDESLMSDDEWANKVNRFIESRLLEDKNRVHIINAVMEGLKLYHGGYEQANKSTKELFRKYLSGSGYCSSGLNSRNFYRSEAISSLALFHHEKDDSELIAYYALAIPTEVFSRVYSSEENKIFPLINKIESMLLAIPREPDHFNAAFMDLLSIAKEIKYLWCTDRSQTLGELAVLTTAYIDNLITHEDKLMQFYKNSMNSKFYELPETISAIKKAFGDQIASAVCLSSKDEIYARMKNVFDVIKCGSQDKSLARTTALSMVWNSVDENVFRLSVQGLRSDAINAQRKIIDGVRAITSEFITPNEKTARNPCNSMQLRL